MAPSRRELGEALRTIGGLIFAVGAVVLLVRKSGSHHWSHLARFLVAALPAAGLYGIALASGAGERWARSRRADGVLTVKGILLVPVALY